MADYRTKRQKLEAMASQSDSPAEAEVARAKLRAMDADQPVGKKTKRPHSYDTSGFNRVFTDMGRNTYFGQTFDDWWAREQSMAQKYLFVGGPWHGQWHHVEPGQTTVEVFEQPVPVYSYNASAGTSVDDVPIYMYADDRPPAQGYYDLEKRLGAAAYFVWRG